MPLHSDDESLTDEPVFTLHVDDSGDRCVVHLVGELDVNTATGLREEVHRRVVSSPSPTLVLELSELTFCDARGLGTMVSAKKTAEAAGKQLLLVGPTPPMRRLLRLTRLDRVLDVR